MVPVLSAWKGLSIGWRIASIAAPILLLVALWGWGWLAGRASCQEDHHAEMMAQAVNVSEHTVNRAESQQDVAAEHQAKRDAQEPQVRVIEREVIKYVQKNTTPCILSPEYIDLADRLIQLQPRAESGVPETDAASPSLEALRTATVTTNQLLLAFTELSNARLRDLGVIEEMQDSDAARFADEMRFWLSLPPQARGEAD